jgi:hypothetical protein
MNSVQSAADLVHIGRGIFDSCSGCWWLFGAQIVVYCTTNDADRYLLRLDSPSPHRRSQPTLGQGWNTTPHVTHLVGKRSVVDNLNLESREPKDSDNL